MRLGEKIKQLRHSCNLTQGELADRCELTKGYISQIENDLTSPSIATLIDILAALGSSLKEFFNDDEEEKIVYCEEEYIEKAESDLVINWLIPNAQKNAMEPVRIELLPGGKTSSDVPHEGEEFGYVLSGEICIMLGKKKHVCKKGNSFYFKADKPHFIKNEKSVKAVFVWVSSPPTF
ncbi:MAG: helix-turn-helix transcriptional regulator [Clostridia bacterium]|nr:helix-turn-helix transcriptional regulator [Clostridia bacterium]